MTCRTRRPPSLAGQTQLPGTVWLMVPSGNQLFALGSDQSQNASQVALNYLDVTNAASPSLIGTSTFGEGWASTPAAGTFKAFTMDSTRGLVVLPFSGWDASNSAYNNGVQLIEFTPTSITTAGAAHTTGWVERGIFVNNRIVSLSDLALSVVDYSNPLTPKVTAALTLARSIVTAQPAGSTIAEVSSDWWDNDVTHSDVRVLPIADAEENRDESTAPDAPVDGVNANVFTNGNLDYIVTNVQVSVPCGQSGAPWDPRRRPHEDPDFRRRSRLSATGGKSKCRWSICPAGARSSAARSRSRWTRTAGRSGGAGTAATPTTGSTGPTSFRSTEARSRSAGGPVQTRARVA